MDLRTFPTFRVAASDLNGQMRGKRVPGSYADKLAEGVVRMPLSVLNVDLWGSDIKGHDRCADWWAGGVLFGGLDD